MQYTIELRGVALGTVDLPSGALTGGTVHPLPGYEEIRSLVRDATLAIHSFGFLGPAADPQSSERANETFDAHRVLLDALTLRDATGANVACEFLDFTEGPDNDIPPFVFISREDTPDPANHERPPITRDDHASTAPPGA